MTTRQQPIEDQLIQFGLDKSQISNLGYIKEITEKGKDSSGFDFMTLLIQKTVRSKAKKIFVINYTFKDKDGQQKNTIRITNHLNSGNQIIYGSPGNNGTGHRLGWYNPFFEE